MLSIHLSFKVISTAVAGDIARALLSEGCTLVSVRKLSRCFQARELDKLCVEETPFLQHVQPYEFDIPVSDPHNVGLLNRRQEMVLPHELFSLLYLHKPLFFHRTFATDGLVSWWDHQDAARMARHDHVRGGNFEHMIPLQLYGDNVSVCKTVSVLVMLWRSCTGFRLPALESLLPVSATPLRHTDRMSLEAVFAVLQWSLHVMATGRWPDRDHRGERWPAGSFRRELGESNTPLVGNYIGIWWELVGDWEWIAHSFGFDELRCYYLTADICHRCRATIRVGPRWYKSLSYASASFAERRSTDEYFALVPRP